MIRIDIGRLGTLRRERDALAAVARDANERVREARDEWQRAVERLRQARGISVDQFGQYGTRDSRAAIALAEQTVDRAERELASARASAEIANERATAAAELLSNCEQTARQMGASA